MLLWIQYCKQFREVEVHQSDSLLQFFQLEKYKEFKTRFSIFLYCCYGLITEMSDYCLKFFNIKFGKIQITSNLWDFCNNLTYCYFGSNIVMNIGRLSHTIPILCCNFFSWKSIKHLKLEFIWMIRNGELLTCKQWIFYKWGSSHITSCK